MRSRMFQISMKRILFVVSFALTLLGFLLSPATVNTSASADEQCSRECHEQLAEARAGTSQYHNESKALEDGFISTGQCVAIPGVGAMGIHYINPARMSDISVEPGAPETLLYLPQENGRMRLVGLEYYAPVLVNGIPWFGGHNNPPPTVDNPPPVLFGRTFDGPMPGHGPGQPWHYSLHVWAWRNNPAGMFAPFNPMLRCP